MQMEEKKTRKKIQVAQLINVQGFHIHNMIIFAVQISLGLNLMAGWLENT